MKDMQIKESIDFEKIYNYIQDNSQEIFNDETPKLQRENLLNYPNYKNIDKSIAKYLKILQRKKEKIYTKESNPKEENTYKHIAINKKFHDKNIQLHISPDDKNMYLIINELIQNAITNEKTLYFKYTRENIKDKIIIYLKNEEDYNEKINMLKEIKTKHPYAFNNLDKKATWFNETEIEGIYLELDKPVLKQNGNEFINNDTIIKTALEEIKTLFYYQSTKQINIEIFKQICLETLERYGLLLTNNKYNKTKELQFPGYKKPLNHIFTLTNNNTILEYGKRLNPNIFTFNKIPLNPTEEEYETCETKIDYYIRNLNTQQKENTKNKTKTKRLFK